MKRKMLGIVALLAVALLLMTASEVQAAPVLAPPADIDDLPVDGWELVDYLNGDENSDDPNEWPTLFKFCSGDDCVEAECTQPGVRVPEIGTEFVRNGEYLESGIGGEQNRFHIVEVLEPPKPKLKKFEVECDCATPGQHSDEVTIIV